MPTWLAWLNPFWVKVAGTALLAGGIAWGYFTVKGWHDDALKLPQVISERDQSRDDYKKLDSTMTGKFDKIGDRLDKIDADRNKADTAITTGQNSIAGQVAAFNRKFPNDKANACPIPQPVRDGLRKLFPADAPAVPEVAGSGGQG